MIGNPPGAVSFRAIAVAILFPLFTRCVLIMTGSAGDTVVQKVLSWPLLLPVERLYPGDAFLFKSALVLNSALWGFTLACALMWCCIRPIPRKQHRRPSVSVT